MNTNVRKRKQPKLPPKKQYRDGVLQAWLEAHPRVWQGWTTRRCDDLDVHRYTNRLQVMGCPQHLWTSVNCWTKEWFLDVEIVTACVQVIRENRAKDYARQVETGV
jgi:hypothetical protein